MCFCALTTASELQAVIWYDASDGHIMFELYTVNKYTVNMKDEAQTSDTQMIQYIQKIANPCKIFNTF